MSRRGPISIADGAEDSGSGPADITGWSGTIGVRMGGHATTIASMRLRGAAPAARR